MLIAGSIFFLGIIALFCIAIIGVWMILIYNRLIKNRESVSEKWSQVQNVYQRRFDLIPNLVEVVKGYAGHERETLIGVTEARSKITDLSKGLVKDITSNPDQFKKFQEAQAELSSTLARLLVIIEKYPELKANANFLDLQQELRNIEDGIVDARKGYNEISRAYNTRIKQFPANIIANIFGLQEKAYFEAEELAQKATQIKF